MFKMAPSYHDHVAIADILLQYEITGITITALNEFIQSSKQRMSVPRYQNNLNRKKLNLMNYFCEQEQMISS